jgi:hypothetical protein
MANLLEFIVKLQDFASPSLKKLSANGKVSFNELNNSIAKTQNQFKGLGMNISQIDARLNKLKELREISFNTSGIKRVNVEIDKLQQKKDKLEGHKGGGFGSGLFGIGLGYAAFSLGKQSIHDGLGRQQDLTALQTLLGKDKGTRLNNDLLEFAKKSIYGNEVFNEGKLLAGSGVKDKKIMPIMKMIGDIAMGDKERMQSIALAFSEASSTGHLNGRTQMMMRTALFNPLTQIAEMTHIPMATLEKDMAKGKISIDLLVQSMEYATGPMGKWHNMMQNMQDTPAGKWIAFEGTMRTLSGTIGLRILPALGKLADFLTWFIDKSALFWGVAAGITAMAVAWKAYAIAARWAAISAAFAEGAVFWPILAIGAGAAILGGLAGAYNDAGKSAIGLGDKANMAANKIVDANGKIINSQNNLKKSFQVDYIGQGLDAMAKKKALENKAYGLEMAYFKKHGSITDAEIFKIKQQVGVPGYEKITSPKGTGTDIGGEEVKDKITGGGVRSITINVAKFQDKTEIHTMTMKEGVHEIEDQIRNMFLRVVNSAATAMS